MAKAPGRGGWRAEALDERLVELLQPLLGAALDLRRVRIVRDARLLPRGTAALVLGHWVFFASGAYRPDTAWGRELLLHELVHVMQWRALGTVRFLARYLGSYARGRWRGLSHESAYRDITLEREACELAAAASGRLAAEEVV